MDLKSTTREVILVKCLYRDESVVVVCFIEDPFCFRIESVLADSLAVELQLYKNNMHGQSVKCVPKQRPHNI